MSNRVAYTSGQTPASKGTTSATPTQFGPYNLDQKWVIEGRGVEPDVVVQNMPGDVLRGKDAQLEAAIANIQQRLAAGPKEIPAVPAFPIKRK